MRYGPEHFKKFKFEKAEVVAFLAKAAHDLKIAREDAHPEVRFTFAYQALIKAALAVLAHEGHRLRSAPGHHAKAIEALSDFLGDGAILDLGNVMRMRRNTSLYDIDEPPTEKEAEDYLRFVAGTIEACKRRIGGGK